MKDRVKRSGKRPPCSSSDHPTDPKGTSNRQRKKVDPMTLGVCMKMVIEIFCVKITQILFHETQSHVTTRGFTISENLKSFGGSVLKCRDSRNYREFYLNELDSAQCICNCPKKKFQLL
jgi:hypothetical protein